MAQVTVLLKLLLSLCAYTAYADALLIEQKVDQKVACESTTLNIGCQLGYMLEMRRVIYGRLRTTVCPHNGREKLPDKCCMSDTAYTILENEGEHKQKCSVLASNIVFTDPCPHTYKYLEVMYQCVPRLKRAEACEGKTLNIQCKQRYKINVVVSNYGRLSKTVCNDDGIAQIRHEYCTSDDSHGIVNKFCLDKQNCSVPAANQVFGDPCFQTYKYLEVYYLCTK